MVTTLGGKTAIPPVPRHWGMAGVFPGAFELWRGDQWLNRLRFVALQGFHGGGIAARDLAEPAKVAALEALAAEYGQRQQVHLTVNYRDPVAAIQRQLLDEAQRIVAAHRLLPLAGVAVIVGGGGHRFDRTLSLNQQLTTLAAGLAPAVDCLRGAGLAVGIENHGDYYLSDLVALCEATPGLGIQLDTGNCFLIGERPDMIPDAALERVCSTHWKDHHVAPDHKELAFRITGATLGRGAVGLTALYDRLLAVHPDPGTITMMVEWVPDPERDPLVCFADSCRHLETLAAGRFCHQTKGVM
jgi:sugar phosphate isomerase/epimerase